MPENSLYSIPSYLSCWWVEGNQHCQTVPLRKKTWKPNETYRTYRFLSKEWEKQLNTIRKKKKKRIVVMKDEDFISTRISTSFYLAVREIRTCHSASSQITAQPVNTNWALDPTLRCFYFLFNIVSCIHVLTEVKLDDPSSYPLCFICQSYKSQRKIDAFIPRKEKDSKHCYEVGYFFSCIISAAVVYNKNI